MRDNALPDSGVRILLVEDDAGIARFIHRGLEANGYSVEWQTLGRHARQRLASGVFEAAILDLGLPDADGRDLCREARAQGIDLPICMLTARAALEDKLEGFRCGADDYLSKPFAMDELLARLSVMVRRGSGRPKQRLVVGELAFDPAARRAAVKGEPLDLSRREFDLLACLVRRAGEVVTRSNLLDEVWGDRSEVTENTVDVYIGYLRRHLAQCTEPPRIETVRGIGFVLRP